MDRREFLKVVSLAGLAVPSSLMFACGDDKPAEETPTPAGTQPAAAETPAATRTPIPKLEIKGPTGHLSVLYRYASENARLTALVDEVTVGVWQNPDQLRADIVSSKLHVAGSPTYVAANLYNKGVAIQLADVSVWGLLWLIANGDAGKSWRDIATSKIAIPFKGDMPDLVFQFLARSNGLDPKNLDIHYAAAPPEALQLVAAGKAGLAVLPEPVATAAEMKGTQMNLPLRRAMNLQEEWAKATGGEARIPQAGTLVSRELGKDNPEVVHALRQSMAEAVTAISAAPAEAASRTSEMLSLEPAVLERSFSTTRLEVRSAREAKAELQSFFEKLAELSPDIIGGELPDDGFYFG